MGRSKEIYLQMYMDTQEKLNAKIKLRNTQL